MINKIKQLAEDIFKDIVEIRRNIHKYPELSFKEYETSSYINSVLASWEISFIEGIADTGIVVVLEGNNPSSKTIALRADFDALPITEENDVEYCSEREGVMHACGHDAHTACLLGALGGAQQMIKEGVLNNPDVEKMFGQHVFPDLEVGKVGFCPGKYMASADEIRIKISGSGGHAALPESYNNPIIPSAKLISNLEEHFMRVRDIPAVFAIGFMNANGYCNVIPDSVDLKGTFRTVDEEFRSLAHLQMQEIAQNVAKEYAVDIDFHVSKGYPCLYNDETLTNQAIIYAKEYMGDDHVVDLSTRMTAEDFSYYCNEVPSCFYRLGTANKHKGIIHGLHTSRFDIDENALKVGMGLMAYLAVKN